jgi:hypothetical protein
MAVDKSTYNRKIKVSQSTIDDIKKLGMSKALRLAKENAAGPQKGLVAEYQEATRRLYGDRRFAAATGASAKKPSTSYSPAPKKASTSYSPKPMKAAPAKKASTSYSPTPMKTQKKGVSGATFLKGVAGTAAAVGLLAAGRGKGAALISKLSPQVGRALNTPVGRALSGTAEKAKANVSATSGRIAATHKNEVSQSQYDKMVSAAELKGTKLVKSTVAKKAPAKKAAAKKTAAAAPKKTGLSAGRRFDANAPKPRAPKKTK